ncbi:MAG: ABC transporter permease subunit [Brevundimonas sp.]|uniref:ABC transporter permease n=1 Tax=Brevundimonas sp. TaxID=1871086 RepID=UPI003002143D
MGLGAALVAVLPLIGVVATALGEGQADIALSDLTRYALTSVALSAQVAVLTAIFGVTAAWLVVGHDFPGRRWLSWALALPLAAPAFALAYGYADLFDAAGDLRIWMRGTLGVDMPFEMRSLGGAGLILSLAFYPYVYLAMRAALLNQSSQAVEAARMLGASPLRAFFQVALPMARPALAAGVALAVMETLADYGAVQFLGVQTLTTGVVRAWFVFGSVEAAARIALPLLAFAAVLMWIERMGRSGADHDSGRGRWRPLTLQPLPPIKAALATGVCLMLVGLGLVLPLGWMAHTMIDITPEWPRLIAAARHSVGLAVIAAVVTVALAALLALGSTRHPLAARLASLGYATPGAVMAIGLLIPAAVLWRLVPGSVGGFGLGIALLIYAYAARLMAAAFEPIEAGLTRVTPSVVQASRMLGRSETRTAWAVQLPLARGALFTAGLVVFVDVMKELPATLMLRPFNVDTLAVMADNYARDERLANAGWPTLLLVLLALPAVLWLTRKISASRPGEP